MTSTYAPRLCPPDPPPDLEPVAVWHFLSDDWEHEHWAQSSEEADELIAAYAERGEPYTVRQLLVEPDECPPREDDSDAYCDL